MFAGDRGVCALCCKATKCLMLAMFLGLYKFVHVELKLLSTRYSTSFNGLCRISVLSKIFYKFGNEITQEFILYYAYSAVLDTCP